MKKAIVLFSFLLIVAWMLAGCASNKPETNIGQANDEIVKNAPDWFLDPPDDPNLYMQSGTGTSRAMQSARDKASEQAERQIALEIEQRFQAMRNVFSEEIGTADESQYLAQFTLASKQVVNQVMSGCKMEKSAFANENGVFRCYVLYSMPKGMASDQLNRQLSQQEELYTRFRASQAFEEMQNDIEAYEQWKQEQGR